MRKLYFVTASDTFAVVFGGHFLAVSPTDAIEIAQGAAERDRVMAAELNMRPLPEASALSWRARKSNADISNAMNGGA